MSMYRCKVCGSPRVTTETRNGGYNTTRGLIGNAMVGSIGLLAGVNGNTITYYHCADCGHTLTEPMDGYTKWAIDDAIKKANDRGWRDYGLKQVREYKQQYPNIEWSEESYRLILESEKAEEDRLESNALQLDDRTIYNYMKTYPTRSFVVTELSKEFDITTSKMSRALRRLSDVELVESYVVDKKCYFRIRRTPGENTQKAENAICERLKSTKVPLEKDDFDYEIEKLGIIGEKSGSKWDERRRKIVIDRILSKLQSSGMIKRSADVDGDGNRVFGYVWNNNR